MSLLKKLKLAVKNGDISSPFTTDDLKNWINTHNIIEQERCQALNLLTYLP